MQHVANQFTEATNSTYTATALHGLIPRHQVLDLGGKEGGLIQVGPWG